MRRVVVTGLTGNVGTALLRRVARQPDPNAESVQLTGVVERAPEPTSLYAQALYAEIDIAEPDSEGRLRAAFDGADAVVHLGWRLQPSHDRALQRAANRDGTRRVVQAAREAGVPHLVHMSSVGTYAPATRDRRVTEDWPVTGIPTSSYSRDKAVAEQLVAEASDEFDAVSVLRPALILQEDAGSELGRYFLGRLVPKRLLGPGFARWLPWPSSVALQVVHADDVADAIVRIVDRRAAGPFNLAAEPELSRATLPELFGGVGPPAPMPLLRAVADLSWRARAQPTEPGWLDLVAGLPLLECGRARELLDWRPQKSAADAVRAALAGIATGAGTTAPPLRPRGSEQPAPADR